MGLYSIIPGFCGAPWVVGAPRIVTTFHPTSSGPGEKVNEYSILLFKISVSFWLLNVLKWFMHFNLTFFDVLPNVVQDLSIILIHFPIK